MSTEARGGAHVLTFTDLIYAALMSYGLALFGVAVSDEHWWAVAYLATSTVWLVYDWYANHYFAVHEQLGGKNIPLDVASLLQYAGLLYAASVTSPWLFAFLAVRGARGILYNLLALQQASKSPRDRARLQSYNYSSGLMVAIYLMLFGYDFSISPLSDGIRLGAAVAVWLIAYAVALVMEARYSQSASARGPEGRDAIPALTTGLHSAATPADPHDLQSGGPWRLRASIGIGVVGVAVMMRAARRRTQERASK